MPLRVKAAGPPLTTWRLAIEKQAVDEIEVERASKIQEGVLRTLTASVRPGGSVNGGACAAYRINEYMQQTLRDMTDAQWTILDPLIPEPEGRKDGRGRPWRGRREVLNGILFILRTGAPWVDLPDRYPPYQTCHRRFQQCVRSE
jgi:hypothetical protein